MIIFFYGPDAYRMKQDANVVLEKFKSKHPSGNIINVDLDSSGGEGVLDEALKNGSLFDDTKLIIVRNAFTSKPKAKQITELLKERKIKEDKLNILLILESEEEKGLKSAGADLFSLLVHKDNTVKKYNFLEPTVLKRWLQKEFSNYGVEADPTVIQKVIEIEGNDSWALANAVQKVANFCSSRKPTLKDVDLLLSEKIELNIFNFIDAVASKNRPQAFRMLHEEMENGRDPYYVFTMIVYQFRNLMAVKDLLDRKTPSGLIAKKAGLHPFAASKMIRAAGAFTLEELKKRYQDLYTLEIGSKNGVANLEDSLYTIVLSS